MANSFFKNGDKAYSENLNDGLLVGNAFDWTVSIGLPADNGGVFPNSSTVVKAKVADVSITPNSNLSIGSTISNSSGSSQVYRLTVYPNFNRYGGFKSISVTASSGVTFYVANKGASTPIANNLDYSDLSSVPELKVLKEYDIVITIPNNKSVTGLDFVFQSSDADVSASISKDDITGLEERVFDFVYPVGSIYMSINNTSPSVLFGGTWEQLKDKFLLSAGDTYTGGSTGGAATVSLTESQMPRHTHIQNKHYHNVDEHSHNTQENGEYFVTNEWSGAYNKRVTVASSGNNYTDVQDTAGPFHHRTTTSSEAITLYEATATNKYTGGSGSSQSASNGTGHNNMPPYLTVYMWKRTA